MTNRSRRIYHQRHLSRIARWTIASVTILLILAVWQAAVTYYKISPRVLASPTAIATTIRTSWQLLLQATQITAFEGFGGFILAAIIGITLGIGLHISSVFSTAFYPILAAAQTIPLISIAPLFIIWYGFEPAGKIVIVALFSVFSIALSTARGLDSIPRFYTDVALTCGAGYIWTLFHVQLRVASHQIFSGLRIAAAYVFATAATAEYLGARNGLGIIMQSAFNSFSTSLIFAASLIIMALTGLLLILISILEHFIPPVFTTHTNTI